MSPSSSDSHGDYYYVVEGVNLPFCILLIRMLIVFMKSVKVYIDILIFDCQIKMKCFAMNIEVNNHLKETMNKPNK